MKTTEQVFGKKLHTYTIVNAIHDGNVLPFRIDYLNTAKAKEDLEDDIEVFDIKREEALLDPRRISTNVSYILDHFAQKTKRNEKAYDFSRILNVAEVANTKYQSLLEEVIEEKQSMKVTGFNSIFATASIEAAKRYYLEFKTQQESIPEALRLKVATIFSYRANEEIDGLYEENNESTEKLDRSSNVWN
jgi:type I restriction enzyme R subunit